MKPPRVMGVVNVTPDSFSDGGRFIETEAAVAHALQLVEDGADILDIGGESTRPGAAPASEAEELDRVLPVIEGVRAKSDAVISIDTMKPAVARAAARSGAEIWNDVTALTFAPDSLAVAAGLGCQVVLMHMKGEPRTMQTEPHYEDVVVEVRAYLAARAQAAMAAGVRREAILIDPGIGFGKTKVHNVALIANLDRVASLGLPVVLGVSRKSFFSRLDPKAKTPADRLGASLATALTGARRGAAVVRVHDVRETVQALAVQAAIDEARRP